MIDLTYHQNLNIGAGEFISLRKAYEFKNLAEGDCRLVTPELLTREDFKRAHDDSMVDRIFDLEDRNGFGDRRPTVLRQVIAANSCMFRAAELALEHGIACAPVSGFHHAGYDYNGLFCTFNGLLVSLMKLKSAGRIERAIILDLDGHYGDGTEDILDHFGIDWIEHYSHGKNLKRSADDTILKVASALHATNADVCIYQAGGDSYVNDPFGVGYFSFRDWMRKDATIFGICKERGIPVAWNLAGGYGPETVKLHYATLCTALATYDAPGTETTDAVPVEFGDGLALQ